MFDEYNDSINTYSAQFSVPTWVIKAVIYVESSGNPTAYRAEPQINDASYGLMQVLYSTAKGLGYTGTPDGLYDPDTNIMLGTKLLGMIRQQVGDNLERLYSAYNSGNPDKYLTSTEVMTHVQRFLTAVADVLGQEPVVSSSGALAAGLLVALLLYIWKGKRK